jgi:hypothetical protein
MGLFDFLKKKEQVATRQTEQLVQNTTEPYLGDLNKTDIIFKLVQTPPTERDETWRQTFLNNIGQASFRCGDPQVITGPDGFPYFQLFLPEPHKEFQCFVIDRMKDDFLLSSGFGIVINPTPNSADWVLSYGDILNLHLNKTFYTTAKTPFSKETSNEIIAENEKVMIGQPSETILPKKTRQLLSEFLKTNGVKSPKILLMMRHRANNNEVSQDIVFNLTPSNFKDESTYRSIMQTISWYLPRHYSFLGLDEKSLGNGFMPL